VKAGIKIYVTLQNEMKMEESKRQGNSGMNEVVSAEMG
jgi:hypothetical protein